MKKSLLALAVLGAFAGAAQAQSSVTIYGIVDTGIAYSSKVASGVNADGTINNGSKFAVANGVLQGSRIGFKGVEDLGGGLSAVFNLETRFNNDDGTLTQDKNASNQLFRGKSVVGLAGGFGSVLLGRQTDFLDDGVGSITSIPDFGGWTSNVGTGLSRVQGTRTNNSIRYNTNNLNGFTGSLIYGFGEQAGRTSAGQAFGAGLKYENGPLALAAAYYQAKLGASLATTADSSGVLAGVAPNAQPGDTALKTFTLAAQYQLSNARVYGSWARTKQQLAGNGPTANNAVVVGTGTANTFTSNNYWVIGGLNNDKTDTFELGGSYNLSPALKLMAAVDHSRVNYVNAGAPKGKLTQISLGADYSLSKRTDLYGLVGYLRAKDSINPGITGGTTGSDGGQTAVAAGIRHKF